MRGKHSLAHSTEWCKVENSLRRPCCHVSLASPFNHFSAKVENGTNMFRSDWLSWVWVRAQTETEKELLLSVKRNFSVRKKWTNEIKKEKRRELHFTFQKCRKRFSLIHTIRIFKGGGLMFLKARHRLRPRSRIPLPSAHFAHYEECSRNDSFQSTCMHCRYLSGFIHMIFVWSIC